MNRQTLLTAVQAATESKPWAIALWEGGSASFGRLDAWSDLDLGLGVEDGHAADGFAAVEAALGSVAPIEAMWEASPVTDKKPQRYYRLQGIDPFLMIDLGVFERSVPLSERYTERRRHGEAKVLFDKDRFTADSPVAPELWEQRLRQRLTYLGGRVSLLSGLPLKSARRGDAAEAIAFYQAFVLRPLTELLRIQHDPWRHDFDVRYLRYDLPAADHQRLTGFWFVTDLPDLLEKHATALVWFWDLHRALSAQRALL